MSRASDAATDEPALASAVSAPEPVAIVVADHGMIVAGTINVRPVEFLVDTGAAVSLLSEALADDLGFAAEHLRPLERVERYCGAGGQPLKLLGTVSVHLQVQACECDHDMRVVRSLRHPCILGRDVLSHIPCVIASSDGKLTFRAGKAEVSMVEEKGCELRSKERVVIPPSHQMVVWAVFDAAQETSPSVVEPHSDLQAGGDLVGLSAVVSPADGEVPVCLSNSGEDPIEVPSGARIGVLCPVKCMTEGDSQLVEEFGDHGWDEGSSGDTESKDLWSLLQVGSRGSTGMTVEPDQLAGHGPERTQHARTNTGAHTGSLPVQKDAQRESQFHSEHELPCAAEADCSTSVPTMAGGAEAVRDRELEELRKMVEHHREVFALKASELGRTHVMEHKIDTGDSRPIFQYPRRLPWTSRETARELVDEMLEKGVVEDSVSPWSAPIVLVKKKDGSTRFCVDYRKLNSATVKDPYPLPRIDETLDSLGGARYFSTLDLCSGYHQLPMAQSDKEKTAFSTPDGHYQFTVMPFGVCNGPSSFQRLMNIVLRGLIWRTCLVYLDDIIVFSKTFEEHVSRLEEVFKRLEKAGLRLKPSKCYLLRDEVEFLGHIVTADGVRTDPAKIEKVVKWPVPTNVGDVRSFLGFCGYYRRFVKHFATIAKPLTNLTKSENPFKWTDQCQAAFEEIRSHLTETPTLAYPRFGSDTPRFVLDVDASGFGLGAVLSQNDENGTERPIAYASRLLTATERKYGSTKSEFLGAVWAFRHFRCYLLGRRFLVRTDHKALEHWQTFKEPSAIMARWMEFLSQFEFDVKYRQGRAHANADGLSRQCSNAPPASSIAVVYDEPDTLLPSPLVQREHWTASEWVNAQSADDEIATFRTWLNLHPPHTLPRLTGVSQALRKFWRGRQQFCVREGVVCKRWEEPDVSRPPRFQILVPANLRAKILTDYHDHAGHQGISRTYGQVCARFHWYGMKRDVYDYVASCESCNQRARPVGRGRGAPLVVTWSGYPFERIAMDLIPNLPETGNGNKHLLVVVDYFTKWVEAYPLKRMDAATIASVFVSEFVSRFGAPESLHTDQGKNFDSKLFKDVCQLLGIRKTRTTAYHPSGDGLVERFNQTLEKLLSHYVADHQRDWDVQLPAMLMAYRSTTQSSTGYTPAYLLFGREVCLPQDVAYGLPELDPEEKRKEQPAYVKSLRERLAHVHKIVRQRLENVHRHQAHLHDAGAVPVLFNEGDLVWLLVPAIPVGTTPKLSKLWRGPFTIVNRLSEVVYRISDSRNPSKIQIVHVNRLKKCHVRPEHLTAVPEVDEPSLTQPCTVEGPPAKAYEPDATDRMYDYNDPDAEMIGGPLVPPLQQPLAAPLPGPPVPAAAPVPLPAVRQRQPPRRFADFYFL